MRRNLRFSFSVPRLDIKSHFHSKFFVVDMHKSDEKNILCSAHIRSSNISASAKFSSGETNQISFLSHVELSKLPKNFYKMVSQELDQTKEKTDIKIIFKTIIIGLKRSVFVCNSFSLHQNRKLRFIFRWRNFFLR